MLNFKNQIKNNKRGFTLVELLVAIFIFSIMAIIVGDIFVRTMGLQRRALVIQQVQENVNFTLELMAREIRVSKICPVTGQCASNSVLDIEHPINGDIQYYLSGGQIHRVVNGVNTIISSSEVEIFRLAFYVSGDANNDGRQSRATIVVGARGVDFTSGAEVNAQTTVSQRFLSDSYKR